jgi:hypothetical protein
LINALPGNSSANTVQHEAIDDAVFSTSSAPRSGGTKGLYNPLLGNGSVNTFPQIGPRYESRVLIKEVNAEGSSVQGSYEAVVS